MPDFRLFIQTRNRFHVPGFRAFILDHDGKPWAHENVPIPENGLAFDFPTSPAQTSFYVKGPGSLRNPHYRNWSNWITLTLQHPGGDIVLILDDCDDIDPGPYAAYRNEVPVAAAAYLPTPEEIAALDADATIPDAGNRHSPVVRGPTDLTCIDVQVSVVDQNGSPVTDYLCFLWAHGTVGRLTQTKEVSGGTSFRVRNARGYYEAVFWQAGSPATRKPIRFNLKGNEPGGIVTLEPLVVSL